MNKSDEITDISTLDKAQSFCYKYTNLRIRLIAFNLDNTVYTNHSESVLDRIKLESYCRSAIKDFVAVLPLYTHYYIHWSDLLYIEGDDLIKEFLKENFKKNIYDQVFMFGYNPEIHDNDNITNDKNYHISKAMDYFNIKYGNEVILCDDSKNNISKLTNGVPDIEVDKKKGFLSSDL